jgi:DNA invertase Pin-like site-specific DNA recombinase
MRATEATDLVGYARVSSTEQNTNLQRDALHAAGVSLIYEEQRSAVKRRPELEKALASLTPGKALVVYKVDRLARSLSHLLHILERIQAAGAGFRSLTESLDTTSPSGRMTLQMIGAFAEYERALIRERSMAGQYAARQRGALIGRPRSLTSDEQKAAFDMLVAGQQQRAVAKHFGVHESSIKRVWLRVTKPDSPAVRMQKRGDAFGPRSMAKATEPR